MFEGVGVSLGSFIAGMLFNSIGGSATFRLFGTGALIFLVVHVVVQKVYARFAGSIGKEAVVRETLPSQRQSQVVYISGNGGSNGPSVEDEKHSMGGGASSILLSEDEAGFREVSLK